MILVTGATGNVGFELVKKLAAGGHRVRAFVRSRSRAQSIAFPGVEFAKGDFTNPATFPSALAGVERLFLLIPSSAEVEPQQRNFVDMARLNKVKHIVKLSQLGADAHSPARFRRYHGLVENHIRKSGVPYTFLRPNLFMQGLLNFRPTISSQCALYAPAGNAKVSVVDARDIASVAARTLTESGHEGKAYDITGPEPLTHTQMAHQLSYALRKPVKFIDVPPHAMREVLLGSGMAAWQADGLVENYEHCRRGEAAMVTSTVRDVTGREPTTFFRFAQDCARRLLGRLAATA
jgi:uncharacterized protein YbjT (DUF2867 family)